MYKRMGVMMSHYAIWGILWVCAAAGMELTLKRGSSSFSALPEQPVSVLMEDDMKSYMIIKRSDGMSILLALRKKDEQIAMLEGLVEKREADADILDEEIKKRDKRIEHLKKKIKKGKDELERACHELDTAIRTKSVTAKYVEDLRRDMEFLAHERLSRSSRSSSQSSTPFLSNSPQLSMGGGSHVAVRSIPTHENE